METPINYSFACTSAIFNANKLNATGKDRPLFKLIFSNFQVKKSSKLIKSIFFLIISV
jgi:hypothetical protein